VVFDFWSCEKRLSVLMSRMADILFNSRKTVTSRDLALLCHLHGNSTGLETWVKSTGMIKDKSMSFCCCTCSHTYWVLLTIRVQFRGKTLANHGTLCQRALCCRAFLCQALILAPFLSHNSHATGNAKRACACFLLLQM